MESVYLSHYFDLDKQAMVQPIQLDELAYLLAANTRIEIFEGDYMLARLANRKFKVQRVIVRDLKIKNKGVKEPMYQEIYDHIEKICWNLYLFISKAQIEQLPKLGILGEWLAQLAADDLRLYKIELRNEEKRFMARWAQASCTPGSSPERPKKEAETLASPKTQSEAILR